MTKAPVVGITTYREQARWGVWDAPADVLHAGYAQALEAAGAAVVLLPPGNPAHAAVVLDRVDGLVVAGGADVGPERYGADPHPRTVNTRPDRDAWELALLGEAAARDLPPERGRRARRPQACAGRALRRPVPPRAACPGTP